MSNVPTWRFISQIQEPVDYHDSAYWFFFQNDKLAVLTAGEAVQIPCVVNPSELGVRLRKQIPGLCGAGWAAHCLFFRRSWMRPY